VKASGGDVFVVPRTVECKNVRDLKKKKKKKNADKVVTKTNFSAGFQDVANC